MRGIAARAIELWHITGELWHITGELWHITGELWHITGDHHETRAAIARLENREKSLEDKLSRLPIGGAFAGLTGDFSSGLRDADVYGGLLGNQVGGVQGGQGYGINGGDGWGTIGTGNDGVIGHGTGTKPAKPFTGPVTVSVKVASIKGALMTDEVESRTRKLRRSVERCYRKHLLSSPGTKGGFRVTLQVGPNGMVSSTKSPQIWLARCGFLKLKLSRPEDGAVASIALDVTLSH